MFLELDKPFLQSLPNERYIYKEFKVQYLKVIISFRRM